MTTSMKASSFSALVLILSSLLLVSATRTVTVTITRSTDACKQYRSATQTFAADTTSIPEPSDFGGLSDLQSSTTTDQSTNTAPPPGPTNGDLNPTATNHRDGAYPFLGCYPLSTQDSGSIIAEGEDMGLTVQKCATFCDHADYFAVQGGNQCICASAPPSGEAGDSADCFFLCAGDPGEFCGSDTSMQVYGPRGGNSDDEGSSTDLVPTDSSSTYVPSSTSASTSSSEVAKSTSSQFGDETSDLSITSTSSSSKDSSTSNPTITTISSDDLEPTDSSEPIRSTSSSTTSDSSTSTSTTSSTLSSETSSSSSSSESPTPFSSTSSSSAEFSASSTSGSSVDASTSSFSSLDSSSSSSSEVLSTVITLTSATTSTSTTSVLSSSSSDTSITIVTLTSTSTSTSTSSATLSVSSSSSIAVVTQTSTMTSTSTFTPASSNVSPSSTTLSSSSTPTSPSPGDATITVQSTTTTTLQSSMVVASRTEAIRLSQPTTLLNEEAAQVQLGIKIPFNISLYTNTDSSIIISTNGLLTLGDNTTTIESFNDNSPTENLPTFTISPGTAAVWWEYLQCIGTSNQGIYYQVDNNQLSVEWLLEDRDGALYHFVATYKTSQPGQIVFYYFSLGDGGANGTIGVQGQDANDDLQGIAYEYGTAGQVDAGKLLTFDTLAAGTPPQGKFDASTFKVDCFPPGSFPLGTC